MRTYCTRKEGVKSLTDDDEDDDEDESKGQRRSKDFMAWEANSDKRVKEMTPLLPWDRTVVQKFHTLYPAPEELNFCTTVMSHG